MHKSKIIVLSLVGLGIISTILPWRIAKIPFLGVTLTFKGIDAWSGYVAIVLFLVVGVLAIIGKKENPIRKGIPKSGILIVGGLLLLFILFLEAAYAMDDFDRATYGLHMGLVASLGCVLVPLLFGGDGSVSIPSIKEIDHEIEGNVEIFEDQVGDVEDKIEERSDKDDESNEGDNNGTKPE